MTLRNKLSISNKVIPFFFGIALITVLVYTKLLMQYFESGIESSAKLRLMAETQSFARAYQQDKETPLPSSYVMNFYYDALPELFKNQSDILKNTRLPVGEFLFIMSDDVVPRRAEDDFVLVLHHAKLDDGRSIYAIAHYDFNLLAAQDTERWNHEFHFILYIGAAYLILTLIALWFFSNRIGQRSKALLYWAEHLSSDTLNAKRPDFRFDEYNRVAACLELALKRNAALVEREKQLLSHASHELRTPIAIIGANIEILERMPLPASASKPLQRIERAKTNMQHITETLLWLERKSETAPAEHPVNLAQLLRQLIDDHLYLIQGQAVDIIHAYDNAPNRMLPATPLMIVLSNLIRNAFQYTHQGWISVAYNAGQIVIENYDTDLVGDRDVVSFGLGLALTRRICHRIHFDLETCYSGGGVRAVLALPHHSSEAVE